MKGTNVGVPSLDCYCLGYKFGFFNAFTEREIFRTISSLVNS